MSLRPSLILGAAIAWLLWCWVVVSYLVPLVLRHLTISTGWTAFVLCLLPILVVAAFILVRTKPKSSESAQ